MSVSFSFAVTRFWFRAISHSAVMKWLYAWAESPSVSANQGKDTRSSVTSIGSSSTASAFFIRAAFAPTSLCRFSKAASVKVSLGIATVSPLFPPCGAVAAPAVLFAVLSSGAAVAVS